MPDSSRSTLPLRVIASAPSLSHCQCSYSESSPVRPLRVIANAPSPTPSHCQCANYESLPVRPPQGDCQCAPSESLPVRPPWEEFVASAPSSESVVPLAKTTKQSLKVTASAPALVAARAPPSQCQRVRAPPRSVPPARGARGMFNQGACLTRAHVQPGGMFNQGACSAWRRGHVQPQRARERSSQGKPEPTQTTRPTRARAQARADQARVLPSLRSLLHKTTTARPRARVRRGLAVVCVGPGPP